MSQSLSGEKQAEIIDAKDIHIRYFDNVVCHIWSLAIQLISITLL